ncbi:hypothetical protein KSAC_34840 (plasmid) [Komagataeibacter saccharivorans]|nr:hypothetical protein KSAC_34840 [Komagataeibacter saccharivorans]
MLKHPRFQVQEGAFIIHITVQDTRHVPLGKGGMVMRQFHQNNRRIGFNPRLIAGSPGLVFLYTSSHNTRRLDPCRPLPAPFLPRCPFMKARLKNPFTILVRAPVDPGLEPSRTQHIVCRLFPPGAPFLMNAAFIPCPLLALKPVRTNLPHRQENVCVGRFLAV